MGLRPVCLGWNATPLEDGPSGRDCDRSGPTDGRDHPLRKTARKGIGNARLRILSAGGGGCWGQATGRIATIGAVGGRHRSGVRFQTRPGAHWRPMVAALSGGRNVETPLPCHITGEWPPRPWRFLAHALRSVSGAADDGLILNLTGTRLH